MEPWSIDLPHTQAIVIMFNIKQMSEPGVWKSMTNHAILQLREQTIGDACVNGGIPQEQLSPQTF